MKNSRIKSLMMSMLSVMIVMGAHFQASATPSVTRLLPETTIFYAEITNPGELNDFIVNHPGFDLVQSNPQLLAAITNNPGYVHMMNVKAEMERRLGGPLDKSMRQVMSGGVYVAIDIAAKGGVLIIKSNDVGATDKFYKSLLGFVKDLSDNGDIPPIEEGNYGGVTGYKLNNNFVFRLKDMIVFASSDAFAKYVIDADQGKWSSSLMDGQIYQKAALTRNNKAAGWAFFRTDLVRALGLGNQLLRNNRSNPAAELLVGGLMDSATQAPFITGEFAVKNDKLLFAAQWPLERDRVSKSRNYFFANGNDGIEVPFSPKNHLANFSMYRDVAGMWNAAAELFDEGVAAGMVKADTDLGNFFAGKSFGADILPQINPRMQLVVAAQDYAGSKSAQPTVKLPAFALVGSTKDPKAIHPTLKVAFNTIIGFVNIDASQKGRPLFDINTETIGNAKLVTATYLESDDPQMQKQAPIYYNFSPTFVMSGEHFMICSTKQLARELATQLQSRKSGIAQMKNTNTFFELDGKALRAILGQNRKQLIAQNMLEKGHGPDQAAGEIDFLLNALKILKSIDLKVTTEQGQMRLESGVSFQRD